MPKGRFTTFQVVGLELHPDGRHRSEQIIVMGETKTPSMEFDEANLASIERAAAKFAETLKDDPNCYRLHASMKPGSRAPKGFNALCDRKGSSLNFLINPEKVSAQVP